ncbi:MAG: hypothetical protein M0C28_21705 [Candidatus Moduliflexus flocculans]|nr:hypothetical protein [Candidatus Moduliflexus flocculans]
MVRHESDIRPVDMIGDGIYRRDETHRHRSRRRLRRVFPGVHRPAREGRARYHAHAWFHASYILEGMGSLVIEGVEHAAIRTGSVAYIEGGKESTASSTAAAFR